MRGRTPSHRLRISRTQDRVDSARYTKDLQVVNHGPSVADGEIFDGCLWDGGVPLTV